MKAELFLCLILKFFSKLLLRTLAELFATNARMKFMIK